MSKLDKSKQSLPKAGEKLPKYATPPTLAGKKGVRSMGVPEPEEKDYTKRSKQKLDETIDNLDKLSINTTNMSKSLFTKLFEDVMDGTDHGFDEGSDEAALGIEDGGEFGGETEGDEVTIKLDRATAEKLIEVLQGAIGGGEEFGESEGEDLGDDEFGGEEGSEEEEHEGGFGESTEALPAGNKAEKGKIPSAQTLTKFNKTGKELQGKNNVVAGRVSKTQGGTAQTGNIPKEQGAPKPLGDKSKALQSKDNKVKNTTAGTFFDISK